jgi:pilus assembly protein CpaB
VSQRRTLILVAAIAIGALASFLVWNYVGGIQNQAYKDAERVKVYLVKQPIARGTSGNVAQQSIVEESIPRKFKPANAIESLDDLAGQVAGSDLAVNQVLVQGMFVSAGDPEAQVSFADNLTKIQNKDMVTFTLSIDEVRGVAGLIVPGDYVNILLNTTNDSSGSSDGASSGDKAVTSSSARYLYQKVLVLAVGTKTVADARAVADASGADPAQATGSAGLITFIVPAEAAQVLESHEPGSIYLSLVSKDYEPVPMGPIDVTQLPGENPSELTPYGPDGARKSG